MNVFVVVVVCSSIVDCRSLIDLNLLEGMIPSCEIQIIGIDKAVHIFMYLLIIRIYIEQHWRHATALWYTILLCPPSAPLTIHFKKKRILLGMFLMRSVMSSAILKIS